jgi:AcrR family transcriptional regulator
VARASNGPRKVGLSRERIVVEAVALADRDGVAGLSMRRLAERLGVEAMSLYHYVANKEQLLDAMVDSVVAEIELPTPGEPWRPAMERRTRSARATLHRHGWAVALMDSRAGAGSATIGHHDAVIGTFRSAGFSIPLVAHAMSLLDSYVHGFVMQELVLPFRGEDELQSLVDDVLGAFPAEQYPHFAELAQSHVLQPGYTYAAEFNFGLELILDGIERARRKERTRSRQPSRSRATST